MRNALFASVALLGLAVSAGGAFAQTLNSDATARSGAVALNGDNTATGGVGLGVGGSQGQSIDFGTNNSRSESNAEPAIAPNLAGLYASPHTCMGSATASVGVGGVFSAGAGSTYQDNECNKREAVKLAAQLGLKGAAAAVFYDIEVVRNVVGTATNAGDVARREAAALAGVQVVEAAPAPRNVSPTGNTSTESASNLRSDRPFWCDGVSRNNARWNECQ